MAKLLSCDFTTGLPGTFTASYTNGTGGPEVVLDPTNPDGDLPSVRCTVANIDNSATNAGVRQSLGAYASKGLLYYLTRIYVASYPAQAETPTYVLFGSKSETDPTGTDRADVEIPPGAEVPGIDVNTQVGLRLAFRGQDGQRNYRQSVQIPYITRQRWYEVCLMVDMRGTPVYAWWLDGDFVYQMTDPSTGADTTKPLAAFMGTAWMDYGPGNDGIGGRVWISKFELWDTLPYATEKAVFRNITIDSPRFDQGIIKSPSWR